MGTLDSISEGVKGFNPDNLMSVFDSPISSTIWLWIKIFFWFALFVFGCICVWKFLLQYKIKITLKTRIGNGGIEVKHDRAKVMVDTQNKKKLQLLKLRKGKFAITCPIPESRYKSKMGKRDHYELWLDDNFQLHPIEVLDRKKKGIVAKVKDMFSPRGTVDASKHLTPVEQPITEGGKEVLLRIRPQERDAWARFEDKALRDKYKRRDMLEKYMPAAIMMMAMITAFLIFFFAFKSLGGSMNNLAQQFGQIASACTRIGVG